MNQNLMPQRLLIVDDEEDMLKGLKRSLAFDFQEVEILTAARVPEALNLVQKEPVDIVLTDIRMPDMDGLDLLQHLLKLDPWLTVIMMTAYGSIEQAVEAMKRGAYDFVTKPFDKEVLLRTIRKALERNSLIRENLTLQRRVGEKAALKNLVGQSPPMRRLLETIHAIARTNYTVLIRGESGTGKELVARAIHELSPRRNHPLVTVNCPAIPEHLLESELFGHKKGAFTGADTDHRGLFDEADGSSLLLDEIGDIPVSIQTKLLRALQEQEIKPLGAARSHRVDARIMASTNQDLEQKIRERDFREDLFYRLNVVTIRTPALADLREDIPLLVTHFTQMACQEMGISLKRFSPKALEALMQRSWPGNVRELQNLVRRAVVFCPDSIIQPGELDFDRETAPPPTAPLPEDVGLAGEIPPYKVAKEQVVNRFTFQYVTELLEKTGGNITRAAELSGLSRVALQKIVRRLSAPKSPPAGFSHSI
ncbi:MAG: sigma-54-dependent transcriptional regulator [Desulfobaccales bacterium]